MHSKIPLQGQELEDYLAKERAAKEKEAAQQAAIVRNQRMLEADEDVSDSDSDSDMSERDDDEDSKAMDTGDDFDQPRRLDDVDWDESLTKQLVSFDIYIKGNVSKSTSFFKGSTTTTTQRFRMFPYIERKRKIDEYGETVDVGMWLRKGKVLEQDAQDEDAKEENGVQEVEDEAKVRIHELIMDMWSIDLFTRKRYESLLQST
jgi:cleavage and polyadenylation specificity factor subunit 2